MLPKNDILTIVKPHSKYVRYLTEFSLFLVHPSPIFLMSTPTFDVLVTLFQLPEKHLYTHSNRAIVCVGRVSEYVSVVICERSSTGSKNYKNGNERMLGGEDEKVKTYKT